MVAAKGVAGEDNFSSASASRGGAASFVGVAVVGLLLLGAGVAVLVSALLAATAKGAWVGGREGKTKKDDAATASPPSHAPPTNLTKLIAHTHMYIPPVWGPVRSGEFQMVTLDFLALCAYFVAPLCFVYYLAAQQAAGAFPTWLTIPASVSEWLVSLYLIVYIYIPVLLLLRLLPSGAEGGRCFPHGLAGDASVGGCCE